ncbi:hypothetical protein PR202_gb02170 [Eleusine coracana subsp. coracana]|uniref:Pollen Ole e 1 allergen and extensin family protein n=1 Tax=Eleusine coracana subsp. coracana TaxID=191504 RepID=A0AAV5DXI8_ELECO|nr:hypothetical protein PR202_gb02170 [Eleusine coracana subsp. coracana]
MMAAAIAGGMSNVVVGAVRQDDFFVEGSVYCDTCRAGFVTNVTTPIAGARVRLECRHFMSASGAVERSAEGVTDAAGKYRVELVDNRGSEEVCAVALVSSPVPGCAEKEAGRDRATVELMQGAGLATTVRRANPLGFLKTQPLPICGQLLSSLALGTAPSY